MFKKIVNKIFKIPLIGVFGKTFNVLSTKKYMKYFAKYIKRLGINVIGTPKYIASDVYFDGHDYSKITLGDNITISREVMFLTHDYSITTAFASIGKRIERGEGEIYFLNKITIGNNCFIGARASILPNTILGDNVIVGACSVVKGKVPDNSIVIGNPAKIIGNTIEYAKKHLEMKDYYTE